MVPVDGSKYNDKAIDVAIEIASKFNSKVIAVHVLNEYSINNYNDEEDRGNEILTNVLKKAEDKNVPATEHLVTGDPLRDMKTIIQKTGADLVVISSLGSDNKDDSYDFGSVANRVLNSSDIPILLIK